MDNGVFSETNTRIFHFFTNEMKIGNSYVLNVLDKRAHPKIFSHHFLVRCFCENMAAPRVFVEVSKNDLVKFSIKKKSKIL